MVVAAFVAPYLLEATQRFVSVAAELPGVRLGLVTCEPVERVPPHLRERLAGHWRGGGAPPPRPPPWGVGGPRGRMGRGEGVGGGGRQLSGGLAPGGGGA